MLLKKKIKENTQITQDDINHISERLLQKNLRLNNTLIEQQQKRDKASLKEKIKKNVYKRGVQTPLLLLFILKKYSDNNSFYKPDRAC